MTEPIDESEETGLKTGMAVHEMRMRMALRQARLARDADEVPIGAVIYNGSQLAGQAWNQTRLLKDPTAHAEMLAITQAASAAGDWRLTESILYVTKEPCPMCAGAIVLARIPLVVWGMSDPQCGGNSRFNILQTPELNHRCGVLPGVLKEECTEIVQAFFMKLRMENKGGPGTGADPDSISDC